MNKYIYIILLIINVSLYSNTLSPDGSFIDLPFNAKSGSLGNTSLSNIGDPCNIITNPANIWFGNRVNSSKNSFSENTFYRLSASNYKLFKSDNNYNIMMSTQFGDKLTIGLGYIGRTEDKIDNYDANANYLGNIEFKESALFLGGASNFGIINIGASLGLLTNNFEGNSIINKSNESYITNAGISLNNIIIRSNKDNNGFLGTVIKILPKDISINLTSKNIIYNDELSNNSTYKNILGFKANYTSEENNNTTYILADYKSNNNITSNTYNFGIGHEYVIDSKFSLGFNTGFKYVNNFESLSFGFEFKSYNGHFSISIANIQTNWNSDYIILTLNRSYDKMGK